MPTAQKPVHAKAMPAHPCHPPTPAVRAQKPARPMHNFPASRVQSPLPHICAHLRHLRIILPASNFRFPCYAQTRFCPKSSRKQGKTAFLPLLQRCYKSATTLLQLGYTAATPHRDKPAPTICVHLRIELSAAYCFLPSAFQLPLRLACPGGGERGSCLCGSPPGVLHSTEQLGGIP